MKPTFTIAIVALAAISVLLVVNQQSSISQPVPVAYYGAETCTEVLEIECAIDVERTVVACAKAFQTEGADIIADIKCAKDLLADKKNCWPCICALAKKKGWKIVGC